MTDTTQEEAMNDDIRALLRDIRSWFSYYDRTLVAKNLRDRIDAALEAPQEPTDADKRDAEIARIKAGYQGCCYACEPVGELNVKLQAEIAELREAAATTDARANALELLLSYGYLEPVTAYNHADWKRDFTAARAAISEGS